MRTQKETRGKEAPPTRGVAQQGSFTDSGVCSSKKEILLLQVEAQATDSRTGRVVQSDLEGGYILVLSRRTRLQF